MIAPYIKHPPFYDMSHWIEVDDFRALNPFPWAIFTKATQGLYFLDSKYSMYEMYIKDAGIRFGAFHYMTPGDDPIRQADWFTEIVIQQGLESHDLLALDMEERGIILSEIKAFLDRVQRNTGTRPIIYSRQELLESLYPVSNPPAWMLDEWFWIAEYPPNPDYWSTIPSWIVPRGISINRIALWQYTDDLVVGGIPGNNVDGNLISDGYRQAINLTEPIINGGTPMPEPTSYLECVSNVANEYRTIRRDHIKTAAEIGRLAAGTKARAIVGDSYIYKNGIPNVAMAGDIWHHVYQNNGAPIDGWMAEIHMGVRYLVVSQVNEGGQPPDPGTQQPTADLILYDVVTPGDRWAARGVPLTKEA